MIEIRLGDRYAKSILVLAKERGELEAVRDDFELIAKVCKENRDFTNLLKSPLVKSDKKKTIVDLVFGGKLSKITATLVDIIIRKRRESYLPDIAERFLFGYDLEKNITRGVLTSSHELSKEQRKEILDVVEKDLNTSFVIEEKVDPELIGGFVLRVGDLLYDGSLSGKLRALKNEFEKNPYIKLT